MYVNVRRLLCLDFFTGSLIHFNSRLFVWLSDRSSSCLPYMVWQTLPSFSLMLSKPETSTRPYLIWTRSFLGSDCMVSCRKTQIHVNWNIYYLQYNNIVHFILKAFILWRWLTHFIASFQINKQTWFMKCSEYVRRESVYSTHGLNVYSFLSVNKSRRVFGLWWHNTKVTDSQNGWHTLS